MNLRPSISRIIAGLIMVAIVLVVLWIADGRVPW